MLQVVGQRTKRFGKPVWVQEADGGTTVMPSTAALVLTTYAPTLTVTVTPTTASLTLTTFAPTLAETVTPTTAALTLTAYAPTVTATENIVVTPTTATLVITTYAPTVTVDGGSQTVTPTTASLVLTTYAPTVGGTVPVWTITFVGIQSCTGDLVAIITTGDLVASQLTIV